MSKLDYAALRRKLAAGKTIAVAAAEAGMTPEQAQDHLMGRANEDDESLRAFADEALAVSLKALKGALTEKNREVMTTERNGKMILMEKQEVVDIPAATALLKAAMDARRMLRTKKGSDRGPDLFDRNSDSDDNSAWSWPPPPV